MMPSLPQILLILLVVLVIFGAGKLPRVMADLGKGMRQFRDGLKHGEEEADAPPAKISSPSDAPSDAPAGDKAGGGKPGKKTDKQSAD